METLNENWYNWRIKNNLYKKYGTTKNQRVESRRSSCFARVHRWLLGGNVVASSSDNRVAELRK